MVVDVRRSKTVAFDRICRQDPGVDNVVIDHPTLGEHHLYIEGASELLFTENETNYERMFDSPNPSPYVKDSINDYIVEGKRDGINPQNTGTKMAAVLSAEPRAG